MFVQFFFNKNRRELKTHRQQDDCCVSVEMLWQKLPAPKTADKYNFYQQLQRNDFQSAVVCLAFSNELE